MRSTPRSRSLDPGGAPALFSFTARGASLFAVGVALLSACGDALEGASMTGARPSPRVLALSTYEASVGSVIDVHGADFPDPDADAGRARLVFRGVFESNAGRSEPVDLEVEPRSVDRATLRWTSFGPFRNPFSARGNEVGTFFGTVSVRIDSPGEISGEGGGDGAIEIGFRVLPSIIVHELEPLSASCSGASKRALSGAPYRVRVEAAGFDPASFTYTLSAPGIGLEPISIRHLAEGRFDGVGARGDFAMPEVPASMASYDAILTIEGRELGGGVRRSAFAIAVHRPLEVFYDGNTTVAEVLAPVPVSACIPGGESGRTVEYSEATEETRTRTYAASWNESWLRSHTISSGSSGTIGTHESNGLGFATSDEENWNWSLGGEVSGSIGLSKLVSLAMTVSGSRGGGGSRSTMSSASREVGIDASTTTTDTEEVSVSGGREAGESFSWEVRSSQHISRGFEGRVIAGRYGVFYRQALRLLRRAAIVTYNQCGAASVVGEVDFNDWTWSPDLALGAPCPPLPKSNLPDAACAIPPCAGGN